MSEIIVACASVAGAGLSFLALRQSLQSARLRKRLKRSLCDNLAQYKLEEIYCHELIEAYGATSSHLGVKRAMRLKLRTNGHESPSSECTPHRISEELSHL